MQIDDVISGYRVLRDRKKELETQHKEEMAPINGRMQLLEAWLQKQLVDQGLKNFSGKSGTAFLQDVTSVTVEDREAMLNWVREKEAWYFLESRVSKTVVQDYMETYKEVPPGINVKTDVVVRIRAS